MTLLNPFTCFPSTHIPMLSWCQNTRSPNVKKMQFPYLNHHTPHAARSTVLGEKVFSCVNHHIQTYLLAQSPSSFLMLITRYKRWSDLLSRLHLLWSSPGQITGLLPVKIHSAQIRHNMAGIQTMLVYPGLGRGAQVLSHICRTFLGRVVPVPKHPVKLLEAVSLALAQRDSTCLALVSSVDPPS